MMVVLDLEIQPVNFRKAWDKLIREEQAKYPRETQEIKNPVL